MRDRLKKIQKITTPKIRKYTIDSVSKYSYIGVKNLVELLSLFPNFGQGFKVFLKKRAADYYIIDHANIKNNRHAALFGMFHKNGIMQKKVEYIRNSLKPGLWNFEPTCSKYITDNGIAYDIKRTEELIEEKKSLMEKRNKMLDIIDFKRQEKEEKKKKKEEANKSKKK
jgi:hypothetical protein